MEMAHSFFAVAAVRSRKEWTSAEDEIILHGVIQFGKSWRKIAQMLPARSEDAVRNRWQRLIPSSGIAAGAAPAKAHTAQRKRHKPTREADGGESASPTRCAWTPDEDANIAASVAELGHKWYQISERLPGRTDHAIRNRYFRLQARWKDLHDLNANLAWPAPERESGATAEEKEDTEFLGAMLSIDSTRYPSKDGEGS